MAATCLDRSPDHNLGRPGAGTSQGRVRPVINRFIGIEHPYDTFRLLKGVAFNTKTDILYPNAYRPAENPGYKTKLKDSA